MSSFIRVCTTWDVLLFDTFPLKTFSHPSNFLDVTSPTKLCLNPRFSSYYPPEKHLEETHYQDGARTPVALSPDKLFGPNLCSANSNPLQIHRFTSFPQWFYRTVTVWKHAWFFFTGQLASWSALCILELLSSIW